MEIVSLPEEEKTILDDHSLAAGEVLAEQALYGAHRDDFRAIVLDWRATNPRRDVQPTA